MKFLEIEWKNIFAYGEQLNKIEYKDNELVLLKGVSGSGKSSILNLPSLLLYGKIEKMKKTSIANRINKNGWIRGVIQKNQHTYIIERTFTPNSVAVFRDGQNIDNYGIKDAQDYIDNEIADIPISTFNNMISISLKKFKSFLTMSPADRKQIIDRVFNLDVVNIAYEKIKKDSREVGQQINSYNSTLFQLQQTLLTANNELLKLQEKALSEENKKKIEENKSLIEKNKEKLQKLNDAYKEYSEKQVSYNNEINKYKQQEFENNYNIKVIQEKIDLFSKDKCPTCGTVFSPENVGALKQQLSDLLSTKIELGKTIQSKLTEVNTNANKVVNYLNQINTTIYSINSEINNLTSKNMLLESEVNNTAEGQSIQNIINSTNEQIETIQNSISEQTIKLKDLQNLALVYSIDGVKQKVIVNYLPILNEEIALHLDMLNFPYQLEIDNKFEPHLKELGTEVEPETLSDGEETRVDLVILCSLFKLLKRRFPTINILNIDEVISSLDPESSGLVLDFLKSFAKDNGLSCFIVSHTDLYLDNFDKIIDVKKDGFSKIEITIPNA